MVTLCADFRPAELRRLGGHLLEVVAPEIAEAEEAKRLQNQEQQARAKTSLRTRLIGDGMAMKTGSPTTNSSDKPSALSWSTSTPPGSRLMAGTRPP